MNYSIKCFQLEINAWLTDIIFCISTNCINIGKTKTMVFGREAMAKEIKVGDQKVENVKEFVYLGSLLTWDNDCTKEIKKG